ncbi:MAG: hypothetical protein NT069_14490 [Planctomycetota bacterium]|nr:hypothetical protein [Planctomycetota bacterium]
MSHSHLALQHLIRKIESPEYRKSRPAGPTWLADFVDRVAELFEPFVDVGRVGFECRPGPERWEIAMYLGQTELIGGRNDGQTRAVAFQFDLLALSQLFSRVDAMQWNAFPACASDDEDHPIEWSFLSVIGEYAESNLRLKIYGTPPEDAGPGMRQLTDGSWEPV